MLFLSLSRVFKFAAQNFWRNIWLSLVSITIIVLTLFSVTALVFVNAVLGQAIVIVKERIDVSVYFKPTATQEQILLVKSDLEKLNFVSAVKYVPKAEALEKLRLKYQDRPLILESLKELDNNPLGDTLVVSTPETSDYQKVIDFVTITPQFAALVENHSFDDNQFIIARLEKLSRQISTGLLALSVFLALAAIMVIVNTIRVAIYTHRTEISIMKLVGASNWFVRGPFILEVIAYAALGVIVTSILSYIFAAFAESYVNGLLGTGEFSLLGYLNGNYFKIFGWEFIGVMLITAISTAGALSRYLKV